MTGLRRLRCIQFELGQRGSEGTSGRNYCGQAPKAIRREIRYLEEVHGGTMVWADFRRPQRGPCSGVTLSLGAAKRV